MPSTFRGLVQKYEWNLLKEAGVSTDVEYLLDADHNVALWARWVNKEFPLNHRNGIAMALMKHQAGSGNVKNWNHYWEKVNAGEDLEYKIETTPYNATGIFVRRVLRDTAIVNAAGLFAEQPGDTHE